MSLEFQNHISCFVNKFINLLKCLFNKHLMDLEYLNLSEWNSPEDNDAYNNL
jgi:hypothetical protein